MEIGSEGWGRLIVNGARALGVELAPRHVRLFGEHATELLKWNQVTNLTTITGAAEVGLNHYVDSLAAAPLIPHGATLLDVGSGGGFPGLPLHVVVPGLKTTLVDAVRKKVSFLRHVIRKLGLEGIAAVHMRVEEFPAATGRESTQTVVISRAFSALAPFLRVALPLVAPGGKLIALKGEIHAAELSGLRADSESGVFGVPVSFELIEYGLPGLKAPRTLLVAEPQARPGAVGAPDGRGRKDTP
jgi:16S rRNA (guanine527-N7)-methyltransferase